jgi:hypothetical protein
MKKPIRIYKLKNLSMEELYKHLELDNLNPNTLIYFTTERPIAKKSTREPMFLGSGIGMMLQSYPDLIKGDTVFDVDAGFITYNGEKWVGGNLYSEAGC